MTNPPVFRFAPSPNGLLHLGHARSALINQRMADAAGGRLLLRVEDIDTTRCTPELEGAMVEDLRWLGLDWEEPVRRQSDHFEDYAQALEALMEAGLVYPSFLSRGEIKRAVAVEPDWPTDPDGSPHYPGEERAWSDERREAAMEAAMKEGRPVIYRLNMAAALAHCGGQTSFYWEEMTVTAKGHVVATDTERMDVSQWGDVVLARADVPTSYHLAVVVDDALQGVTHVVRGRDLFAATGVHALLQKCLGFPAPLYHHHELVMGDDGRKLSKSQGDTALRALREAGLTPEDIARMVGLEHQR
ncbi:MAG: tRNA glutamyl-Q(34) synthetase GluQRS [Pseudomonadota bacterium]